MVGQGVPAVKAIRDMTCPGGARHLPRRSQAAWRAVLAGFVPPRGPNCNHDSLSPSHGARILAGFSGLLSPGQPERQQDGMGGLPARAPNGTTRSRPASRPGHSADRRSPVVGNRDSGGSAGSATSLSYTTGPSADFAPGPNICQQRAMSWSRCRPSQIVWGPGGSSRLRLTYPPN